MKDNTRWIAVVIILLVLGFFGIIFAGIISLAFIGASGDSQAYGNVAFIPVKGIILTGGRTSFLDESIASSTQIVEWIEEADSDPSVDAIVMEIDSGGGAPVASEEIANALSRANKTTVAWIREVGASGAYWVSSACDHIVASRMSITGSIGVTGSYLELSGLLERFNVTYQGLYAGELKEAGSPYKELTEDERQNIMATINALHEIFISEVSSNRGMPSQEVRDLATGEVFIGLQAEENGLVDELGGKEQVITYLEENLGITVDERRYSRPVSLVDMLRGVSTEVSYNVGRGIGRTIIQDDPKVAVMR